MNKLPTNISNDIIAWSAATPSSIIVIPVNLDLRTSATARGAAIMGAGLAMQVRDHYRALGKDLERELGGFISTCGPSEKPATGQVWISRIAPVIYFATKYSWRDPADVALITANLIALAELSTATSSPIGVPLLGTGLGGLPKADVIQLIQTHLSAPCVLIDDASETPSNKETTMFKATVPAAVQAMLTGKKVVAATGHRSDKLGGYDPATRNHLRDFAFSLLQKQGAEVVISGMALGWDTAVAEAAEMLGLPLIAAIPCQAHSSRWPADSVKRYDRLLAYAQKSGGCAVLVTDLPYQPQYMQDRNIWMCEAVKYGVTGSGVIALWDSSAGGTANCLQYVKSASIPYLGNSYKAMSQSHPDPAFREAALVKIHAGWQGAQVQAAGPVNRAGPTARPQVTSQMQAARDLRAAAMFAI